MKVLKFLGIQANFNLTADHNSSTTTYDNSSELGKWFDKLESGTSWGLCWSMLVSDDYKNLKINKNLSPTTFRPSSTSKISQSHSSNGLSGPDFKKLDQEQKCQAVICTKLCFNYMHQYFWISLLHHIDMDGITFLSFKSPLRTMCKRWHRGYQTMSVMNNFNQYSIEYSTIYFKPCH